MSEPTYPLVLLRHGQSDWNEKNLFTGWVDVGLTAKGEAEARRGGELLRERDLLPDVLHTSVMRRAIQTANIALESADRMWLPVRRSWRLNERHYGALQGKDKKQTLRGVRRGAVHALAPVLRHPAAAAAPTTTSGRRSATRAYAGLPDEVVPRTECLKDVVVRMLPYWYDAIVPDLQAGRTVLVVAHGNSLRALVKHLDGISDEDIAGLNIPTGIPLLYQLDADLQPDGGRRGVPRPGRRRRRDRGGQEPGPLTRSDALGQVLTGAGRSRGTRRGARRRPRGRRSARSSGRPG